LFEGLAETLEFSLDVPWKEMPQFATQALLFGAGSRHITYAWRSRGRTHFHGGTWEGVIPQLLAKYRKTNSPMHRAMYEKYMRVLQCPSCQGMRLNPQARSVQLAGKTLIDVESTPVETLAEFIDGELPGALSPMELQIAGEAVKEIRARLGFLLNVGLGYLSLDRSATTLSGGEAQRIRLAGQIGSGLVGVLYVLDEPSIGLHPRDNTKLLGTLARLRDQGNTVVVVEHDEETIRSADYIVDFGPGPGVRGGEVVAQGRIEDVLAAPRSVTGRFLSGEEKIEVPSPRRPIDPSTKPSFSPEAKTPSKRKAAPRKPAKGKQ
jgi:excinuclease ABC subunit A